ncbi:MAG: E3 ubiquitin-protein ligase RNF14 [Sylvanvirus sp.]|uniref:E3 ubiquitin-protein ligase RNF14 n=1 Tax=Sylvanvirus sp. TaxID=2487774 RepID=A0A3G5AL55_9VIRU|nr:MAG: E3 ubiquitin-protein ligase RNF14 [Sylvanvirus sp.]
MLYQTLIFSFTILFSAFIIYYRYNRSKSFSFPRNADLELDTPINPPFLCPSLNVDPSSDQSLKPHFSPICSLCLEVCDRQKFVLSSCSHVCCQSCFIQYVATEMEDCSCAPLKCFGFIQGPNPSSITRCQILLDAKYVYKYCPVDIHLKYDTWSLGSIESLMPCYHCNNIVDMGIKVGVVKSTSSTSLSRCPYCHCTLNLAPTCSQVDDLTREFLVHLDELKLSQCPTCGLGIEKVSGCNHMSHKKCPKYDNKDVHFCYICNDQLTSLYPWCNLQNPLLGGHYKGRGVYNDCINAERIRNERQQRMNERILQEEKSLEVRHKLHKSMKYKVKLIDINNKRQFLIWVPHLFRTENKHLVNAVERTCDCLKLKPCPHIDAAQHIYRQITGK